MVTTPNAIKIAQLRNYIEGLTVPSCIPFPAGNADSKEWLREQKELAREIISAQTTLAPNSLIFDLDWSAKLPSWRSSGEDQPRCYAYAMNRGRGGYSIPGHYAAQEDSTGKTFKFDFQPLRTPERLSQALQLDGLRPLTRDLLQFGPLKGWVISSFLRPDGSFHFKRLDANGVVSDKKGLTAVARLAALEEDGLETCLRELMTYRDPGTKEKYSFTGLYTT